MSQQEIEQILSQMDNLVANKMVEIPKSINVIEAIKTDVILSKENIAESKDLISNLQKLQEFTVSRIQEYKSAKSDGELTRLELFVFIKSVFSEELVVVVHSILNNLQQFFVDSNFEQFENKIKEIINDYVRNVIRDNIPSFLKYNFIIDFISSLITNVIYNKLLKISKTIHNV